MSELIVDVMRHGDKAGDELTEKGIVQVKASARAHIADMQSVDALIYSGANRTRQSSEAIAEELGLAINPVKDAGLHFDWAVKDTGGIDAYDASEDRIKRYFGARAEQTVAHWLLLYPGALILRGQLRNFLLNLARDETLKYVVCCSHSPTAEMAAVDPSTMPILFEADIVRYTIDTDVGNIISSQRFPCPLVGTIIL